MKLMNDEKGKVQASRFYLLWLKLRDSSWQEDINNNDTAEL